MRGDERVAFGRRFDFNPITFRGDVLYHIAPFQNAEDAVVFARAAAQFEFLRNDRFVGGFDESGADPGVSAGGQHDFRPGRRLVRPGIIARDLLDDHHRLAFGDAGNDLAVEPGLAAHIDVAGDNHGRAGDQRHRLQFSGGVFFLSSLLFRFLFGGFFLFGCGGGRIGGGGRQRSCGRRRGWRNGAGRSGGRICPRLRQGGGGKHHDEPTLCFHNSTQ